MYEEFTQERIANLRKNKGVSANDMSLSLGQNSTYINKIENKKSLPSLPGLFYICDFFRITPQEFFDEGNPNPEKLKKIIENLKLLDEKALDNLSGVIEKMVGEKNKLY